jgi:divalent metal cation (Fe/Co/Zn/Cd) transporter
VEEVIGTALPYIVGFLLAAAVFMVYLELAPSSRGNMVIKAGGRKNETMAEMHASTPWTSTLAAMMALAVVFIVKRLATKVAIKVGL